MLIIAITAQSHSLTIIRERLDKDQDLKKRTNLDWGWWYDGSHRIYCHHHILQFQRTIIQTEVRHSHGQPVSPILANFFMEWLEQQAIATAPIDCKHKLWKRYVDDILEIIKRGKVEALTDHLWVNEIYKTNGIKFTHEPEKNGQIPFLDTLITCLLYTSPSPRD